MDKEAFIHDLERFEQMIISEFETGLAKMKVSLEKQEINLRNDMHSAIGGFLGYMRDRYGKPNGVINE